MFSGFPVNIVDTDGLRDLFEGMSLEGQHNRGPNEGSTTESGKDRRMSGNCGGNDNNKNKGPSKKVEPDYVHQTCEKCGRSKDVAAYISNIEAEQEKLREKNRILNEELAKLKEEFEKLSEDMANSYRKNNSGRTERSEDKMSPSKIADKFESIYDGIYQDLIDDCRDDREGIEQLKLVLYNCYKFSEDKARSQIYHLLFPNACHLEHLHKKPEAVGTDEASENFWEETALKKCITDEDLQELYRIRYTIAQHEDTINEFKTDYMKYLHSFLTSENITIPQVFQKPGITEEDVNKSLTEFYDQCAECCWLMATCRPSVQLKFTDPFSPLVGEITKCFQVLERDNPVENVFPNRVTQLLWPAVVQQRKGRVTVYKEGRVYASPMPTVSEPLAKSRSGGAKPLNSRQTTIN